MDTATKKAVAALSPIATPAASSGPAPRLRVKLARACRVCTLLEPDADKRPVRHDSSRIHVDTVVTEAALAAGSPRRGLLPDGTATVRLAAS